MEGPGGVGRGCGCRITDVVLVSSRSGMLTMCSLQCPRENRAGLGVMSSDRS